MALVQDMTVRYNSAPDGENFTWSLSKTLNELTADDIKTQDAFTGFNSFAINQMKEGVLSQGAPENNPNHCYMWATVGNVSGFPVSWNTTFWSYPANNPSGVYMRTILVHRPLNKGANTSLTKALNDVRIVLDVTPDANTNMQNLAFNNPYVEVRYNNNANGEIRLTDNYFISPACIMIVNNVLYLWVYGGLAWFNNYSNGGSATIDQGYSDGYTNFDNQGTYHRLAFGWTLGLVDTPITTGLIIDASYPYAGNGHFDNVDFNGHSGRLNVNMGATNYNKRNSISLTDNENKTITKMYAAFSGLKFIIDNVWYKPIIQGGVVTGYTDDMTVPSEWDNWTSAKGHNVPDSGGGGDDGDDAEAETFGWGGSEVHGMVRYYLLTQAEMESLQSFMSNANWRMDYRNCVIGMFVVPNDGMFFDAAVPTTLKFRIGLNEYEGAIPPDEELDTGISCKRITGVVNNDNAVIEIPRMNGNFLDYEPYSKYMVYVPFCGVVPLPDYIAGKEIKVAIYPDVPTCMCTAVISSEGRKIATVSGAFGSQLPLTSDGSGLKALSAINSIGNMLMGGGELALGIATGNIPLGIMGGAQLLGSSLQTDLTLGQAFGYSIGSSGDTSFFGAGNRCEYYIAFPEWNNPDGTDTNIYGHTYGFVVNKRGVLGDFEGFTVCDNPHVTGFSCTSEEKDEIERLLREGIIIHNPSE
jgi:hypothetical protein